MAVSVSDETAKFAEQTGKSDLKILIVGKTGVGKSALINALAGYELSPESEMETGTYKVEQFEAEIYGGIKVKFYDTPGLHDTQKKDKQYLQQIIDNCQDLDLVLFCAKLTDTRVTEEDCDTICEFTRALGEAFWENSVFVLTFANKVRPKTNIRDPEMKKKALKHKIDIMTKKLREILRSKAQLSSKVVKKIPFVPAGYYTEEHQILPDGSHWFSIFWAACFTRIRDAAKPAVINGCLDMFEVENEKYLKTQSSAAASYPMPVLTSLPTHQALMQGPSNRRAIPMGIQVPSTSSSVIDCLSRAIGGDGIPGALISAFMTVSLAMLNEVLEDDDEDNE